jgi:hypothetical protein
MTINGRPSSLWSTSKIVTMLWWPDSFAAARASRVNRFVTSGSVANRSSSTFTAT